MRGNPQKSWPAALSARRCGAEVTVADASDGVFEIIRMFFERADNVLKRGAEMRPHRLLAAVGISGLQRIENDEVLVDCVAQGARPAHREMADAEDLVHRLLQHAPCRV